MRSKLFRTMTGLLALLALSACGQAAPANTTGTPAESTGAPTVESTTPQSAFDTLDGKRIIFIGNSYTHAANAVIDRGYSVLTQEERMNDEGYFYQICKRAGLDVNVTAWCFGGHNITDTFAESCTAKGKPCEGQNHPAYIKDPYYDYVAIQPYKEGKYMGDLMAHLQPIVDFFRKANPNVKFLLLVPHMAVERNYAWAKDLDQLADSGFIICNWGSMLHDICQKTVEVPGATQPFGRPTFVISASAEDGHHQNMLAGYLTALMAYCAITGDSAVGHPYDFCYDSSIHRKFEDFETYKSKRYVYDIYTNFDLVFQSEPDMLGLQQLVDQYIEKYN